MKKIFKLSILLAASVLFFAGCNNNPENDTVDTTPLVSASECTENVTAEDKLSDGNWEFKSVSTEFSEDDITDITMVEVVYSEFTVSENGTKFNYTNVKLSVSGKVSSEEQKEEGEEWLLSYYQAAKPKIKWNGNNFILEGIVPKEVLKEWSEGGSLFDLSKYKTNSSKTKFYCFIKETDTTLEYSIIKK